MNLRDAIRTIVEEVAGDEIRRIVREVLIEELMADENPRTRAAKKAAATKRARRESASHPEPVKSNAKVPAMARKLGVAVGQKYKGKAWSPKTKDRVIEVAVLEEKAIVPKILSTTTRRPAAKRISYDRLMKSYDRVE